MAAEQDNAVARYNLGVAYAQGKGVPQDYAEALKWYRLAAEQDNAVAQYNLGMMYAQGQGVPQDYPEAIKWFRLATEQGYASAQFNLGVAYAQGKGVPRDYVQAHKWLNLAASRANAEDYKDFRAARDAVAGAMTAAQSAEAQRLVREWKVKTGNEWKEEVEK